MKDEQYWKDIETKAQELGSDGCTVVADFYLPCCYEHDIAYRTGCDVYGNPVTRAHADSEFRRCMQSRSRLGILNPMSWWRWIGVRLFGRRKDAKS